MFILFLCFSFIVLLMYRIFIVNFSKNTSSSSSFDNENIFKNQIRINYFDFDYNINWFTVNDLSKINLYSNLKNRKNSLSLKEEQNCQQLFNGGFYDQNYNHLGLLVSDGKILSNAIFSDTFNSFFSLNENMNVKISKDKPSFPLKIALQTGPMLFENGKPLTLDIINDKYAKRAVMFLDGQSVLSFLVIYDAKTNLSGPPLANLPEILEIFESESGINIEVATNLDGGGALSFITDEIKIMERELIGSYFCVK